MSNYTRETVMEIWNDDTGDHWEVGQDRDSLQLVEIREYNNINDKNNLMARITLEKECAIKIAEAILEYCRDERNFV